MNLTQPTTGWTPDYLGQLNQIADSILARPDTTPLHGLSEGEFDYTWRTAWNDYKIFQYYDLLFVSSTPDPEAWINKRVAARCWMKARLSALRTLKNPRI